MASPQVEKGYTRVANEILENIIKTNLNGTQYRLVMLIWRYTYGFKRTSHDMSLSWMAEKINASRSQVDRELSSLIDRNIVFSKGTGTKGARKLGFNKNHEEWQETAEKRKGSLTEGDTTKKEKQPKKSTKKQQYSEENSYYKMAVYFLEKVTAVAKDAGVEHLIKKANLQTWADDFRKLIEIDGVDKRLAKDVMDWVTQDSFWRTNVLSARKLREKFTELAIKMNSTKNPKHQPQQQVKDSRDKEIEFQKFITAGGDPDEFDWS